MRRAQLTVPPSYFESGGSRACSFTAMGGPQPLWLDAGVAQSLRLLQGAAADHPHATRPDHATRPPSRATTGGTYRRARSQGDTLLAGSEEEDEHPLARDGEVSAYAATGERTQVTI